jgi:hypothetical protein
MFSAITFSAIISSAAILFLGAGQTLALPQVCVTPSYGPFKLFAYDGTDTYTVRLKGSLTSTSSSAFPFNSTMVVDLNSVSRFYLIWFFVTH